MSFNVDMEFIKIFSILHIKHRSLVLLVQTEIGMLHDFVKFRQWKGRQRETKVTKSDRFLGPKVPQKGPLFVLCHNSKKNWPFFIAFHCIKFLPSNF